MVFIKQQSEYSSLFYLNKILDKISYLHFLVDNISMVG